ncbi:hypothetical protein HGRIS_011248 [Hohenbuehelia grisea]|uniref:F-box domain-containing protein n=1 Tax=Hohenbuehelia grisea TaxID=104357 RepID=A0ABR3JVW5_9AGAR
MTLEASDGINFLPLTRACLSMTSTSAFPDLWDTNAAPSTSDASIIRSEINSATNDLFLIRNELLQLQAYEKSLNRRLAKLQQFVDTYQPVVSGVRRLPPEILLIIFRLYHLYHEPEQPWYVSMVCRTWRSVALSAPHMWSTISIESNSAPSSNSIAYTKELIQRSAAAPLTVEFAILNMHPKCLRQLLSASHRWQKATIAFSATDKCHHSFLSLRDRLQVLRELVISGNSGGRHNIDVHKLYMDVFWNAPSLQSLTIISLPLTTFRLPWHQLRRLVIRYADQDLEDEDDFDQNFQDVLRNVPLLVELKIIITHHFTVVNPEPITIPRLEKLEIACDLGYFHLMTLPSLQTLISAPLFAEDTDGIYEAPPLVSLLSRSHCSLKYLKIDSTDLPVETAVAIFQATPTLNHLVIDRFDMIPPQLFNAMTLRPAQPNLLPQLLSVDITAEGIDAPAHEVADAALEFCESRCKSDLEVKLASAFFFWNTRSFCAPSRSYRVQRLADAGLKFAAS